MSTETKPAHVEALQQLARDLVGDYDGTSDRRPNLYFVTDRGTTVTVSSDLQIAYSHYRKLADRRPMVECALEDRRTGVLASVEPEIDAPGARLREYDNVEHVD